MNETRRPIRYCERCGEYVADRPVTRYSFGGSTTTNQLVHIDPDGNRIHRAHTAVEDRR